MMYLVVAVFENYFSPFFNRRNRAKMKKLAQVLKQFAGEKTIRILSSPVESTRKGAMVLSNILGVGFEGSQELWLGPEKFKEAAELVQSHKDDTDILILVTDTEYARSFPTYFARNVLGADLSSGTPPNGTAWVIDCLRRTIFLMNPR